MPTRAMPMTAPPESSSPRERGSGSPTASSASFRPRTVAPVVGTSALQVDIEPEVGEVVDAQERAALAAEPRRAQSWAGEAWAGEAWDGPVPAPAAPASAPTSPPERAAGVRRPPLPRPRPQTGVSRPPSGTAAVETPERGLAPRWAPVGAPSRVTATADQRSRPRRHRHDRAGRAGLVWTWRTAVKVLVVAIMLVMLVLWLGTLAQASALALGAVAVPGRLRPPGCGSGRRRPTSG